MRKKFGRKASNHSNFNCLLHMATFLSISSNQSSSIPPTENYLCNEDDDEDDYYSSCSDFDFHTIAPITVNSADCVLRKIGHGNNNNLSSLKLSYFDFDRIRDAQAIFNLIGQLCKNLKIISIYGIDLSVYSLSKMLNIFPFLTHINLINCNLTDELIEMYMTTTSSSSTKLKHLNISSNFKITGKCLISLLKTTSHIESLNISACVNLQQCYFAEFCKRNGNLLKLNIDYCFDLVEHSHHQSSSSSIINIIPKYLLQLNNLSMINSEFTWTAHELLKFSVLTKLKKISMGFCVDITVYNQLFEKLTKNIESASLLQSIHLYTCNLNINFFQIIIKFNNLKTIALENCKCLTDDMLDELSKCSQLNEISIQNSENITTHGLLNLIAKLRNIQILNIIGCKLIDGWFYFGALNIQKICKASSAPRLTIFASGTQIKEEDILENNDSCIHVKF